MLAEGRKLLIYGDSQVFLGRDCDALSHAAASAIIRPRRGTM